MRNRGTATARSFVVGFKLQVWAGTQFVYPGDWFPLTAVAVGFDLAPGASKIVRARLPAADIPPEGSHGCLLAMAWCIDDRPDAGRRVWEDDTLAQRNLTVVDAEPNEWEHLPFRIGSRYTRRPAFHRLELIRPREWPDLEVRITHRRTERVKALWMSAKRLKATLPPIAKRVHSVLRNPESIQLAGGRAVLSPTKGSKLMIGPRPHDVQSEPGGTGAGLIKDHRGRLAIRFDAGPHAALAVGLYPRETLRSNFGIRAQKPVPTGRSGGP